VLISSFCCSSGAGSGVGGTVNILDRFRALVPFAVEDHVLDTIVGNGWLSSRVGVIQTVEQATALYNEVIQIPWSQTRAEVLHDSNVTINGTMPVAGAQTATFHFAFEEDVPRVLKIPLSQSKVDRECELYEQLGSEAECKSLALVPVRKLKLRGSIRTNRFSPEKLVGHAILMPPYWCTAADIPPPASKARVMSLLARISPALDFIHQAGWIHGDIKPTNIFLDVAGVAWLGDYGSSIRATDHEIFTGGTVKYQVSDVTVVQGSRFDRVGLALVLLDMLGLKFGKKCSTVEIRALVVSGVTDAEIKSRMIELIS
jgi:hypothetical protein